MVLYNFYLYILQMIFLPECCDYIGESRQNSLEMAEHITGPTVTKYRNLAKDLNVWLSLGGVHEKVKISLFGSLLVVYIKR